MDRPPQERPSARRLRRVLRGLRRAFLLILILLILGTLAIWLALRASLPQLEGGAPLAGLTAPATIERDAQGVPVIRAATRADLARATGYAHAQDRYFQMDLLRRTGAGELAALLGPAVLDTDRRIRLHRFRARARAALAALAAPERALLEAYADGVNAGLAAAGRPFEYLLLMQEPLPWRAEDSALVIHAMWIDLQGLEARTEQQRGRLAAALPPSVYRLLTDPDPLWEAPLDGSRLPQAPLPPPEDYDLRRLDGALFARHAAPGDGEREMAPGSNNWAVAGARSADGAALVANDMHLGLNVPNIWYRARLVSASPAIDLSGLSLPGVPAIIAGSNGRVAWGFTNSYGDFQDLVAIEPGPAGEGEYLAPGGPRAFETFDELIEVKGAEPVTLEVRETIWGPVIGEDGEGRELALAWTAHRPGATDLVLLGLETAADLDEAAAVMGGAGMPGQNVMIADAGGRIGWVLSGRLPKRMGHDPLRPAEWHRGGGWDGWLPRENSPRLLDPPQGYAWSANARVAGGEMYGAIGDGDYAPAARSRQIRDRLRLLERATPADLLAIQLDDEAAYLAHWQALFVRALERAGAEEAAQVARRWRGRAAVDDPAYRLLREFEDRLVDRAFEMLTVEPRARWPDFRWRTPQRFTEVAWRLVQERPAHLLDPRHADWDDWLAAIAREVAEELPEGCDGLAACDWGRVNRVRMRHPISEALPFLSRFLDMPSEPLPGDWSTPRVQRPRFGASERFVVSPGREAEGFLHMPGGQSGHPLSPWYRAGHEAWVRGEATPFLPGAAVHTLTLLPE